jgi:hypothetical protein
LAPNIKTSINAAIMRLLHWDSDMFTPVGWAAADCAA